MPVRCISPEKREFHKFLYFPSDAGAVCFATKPEVAGGRVGNLPIGNVFNFERNLYRLRPYKFETPVLLRSL